MSVAFSPDGKLLVAGDNNGHTYLWDVATGKLIVALPDPGTKGVTSVACSPDNTTMAAARQQWQHLHLECPQRKAARHPRRPQQNGYRLGGIQP